MILRQVDPFLHRTHETEMVPWPVDFYLQVLVGIQDLFSRSALGEFRNDIFFERNFGRGNIRNSTDRSLNRDEVSWHLFWQIVYVIRIIHDKSKIKQLKQSMDVERCIRTPSICTHLNGAPDEVLSTAFACLCFLLGLCTFTCCYLDLPA